MRAPDDRVVVETRSGFRALTLSGALDAARAERAEVEANAWIKALRALPVEGRPMRDQFRYRGDSLWWFTELYFHKTRVVSEAFRQLIALEAIVERHRPSLIRVPGRDPAVRLLASEVARSAGIGYEGAPPPTRQPGALMDVFTRAHLYVWQARLAAARAPRRPPGAQARVAAFVHAAFWRDAGEQYVGPVLQEISAGLSRGQLTLVGVGPQTSYRARRWTRRLAEAGKHLAGSSPFTYIDRYARPGQLLGSRAVWRARSASLATLRGSAAMRAAAVVHGCNLWPLIEPVVAGAIYLQLPWSAHVMDQMGAALDELAPRVAVTYAEAGGWGRALVLEARRRQIATVGLQHGFIYRHWLNYLHEPDEMLPSPVNPDDRGFPAPTRTLVYDRVAADHLRRAGHFSPDTIVVTGSARLDALTHSARSLGADDLSRIRRGLEVADGQTLVVIAAKHTQIARVFRDLVAAASAIPGVVLVVKCHPAEGPEPYGQDAAGASCVRIAGPSVDLAGLVRASRLLVTVNSTAAVEAMVLGTPALVLALPNNLSPFVDAGVMIGVADGAPIEPSLRAALFDDACRADLAARADAFMRDHRIVSDGSAARRAAHVVLGLAGPSGARLGIS